MDTSTLVTNVRNFPDARGSVVGILKAFLGLSASLYTTLYLATYAPDAAQFLRVLAFVPPAAAIFLSLFVNHVPYREAVEGRKRPGGSLGAGSTAGASSASASGTDVRFRTAFALVAVLAAYQLGSALLLGSAPAAAGEPPAQARLVLRRCVTNCTL